MGGGATIRGGKLQWWAGPGCSVRHGALFRDEIMGWPGLGGGHGHHSHSACRVPTPGQVSVSCTVTRVSAPTTYTELCLRVKCRFRQTHAGWHILQWQLGTDKWQEDVRSQFYLYSKQIPSASGAI